MGWKKLVIVIVIFSFPLTGCVNYYTSVNGGYRPNNPKFSLSNKPYRLKSDDLIKPNSVYLSTDTLSYGNYKSLFYLLFFDNGRCATGSVEIGKKRIVDDIKKFSNVGYFQIDEKNKIEFEIFYVKNKERGWYEKSIGFISKDSIIMEKKNSENSKFLKFFRTKKDLHLHEILPDW